MKNLKYINLTTFNAGTIVLLLITGLISGCEKYLNVPLPTGYIAGSGVYSTNESAGSVLSGIYWNMINGGYTQGGGSVGYYTSLYADETASISPGGNSFYSDVILPGGVPIWSTPYANVYGCNAAIAGIQASGLTNKNQYLGEAYFTRAWIFFNLTNLFGDIPLPLNGDYQKNAALSRVPQAQVYTQIISDLKNAEGLLSNNYQDVNGTVTTARLRPNKLAAQALLARVYLYQQQWANAETEASAVISNTSLQLTQPSQTFLAASTETIWALAPTGTFYVNDYQVYYNGMPSTIPTGKTVLSYGPNVALSSSTIAAFENNDTRLTSWVNKVFDPSSSKTYYFPYKYKSNINGVENMVVLRLAEVYLIRAEARAMQNETPGAQADINVIRTRAGLSATTASSQQALVDAVFKERRCELFTEQGMRFFDLKRSGTIDAVMTAVAPSKGATWTSQKQVWPIPATEILADPNLTQNPGY